MLMGADELSDVLLVSFLDGQGPFCFLVGVPAHLWRRSVAARLLREHQLVLGLFLGRFEALVVRVIEGEGTEE